jgi:hypothetical protein
MGATNLIADEDRAQPAPIPRMALTALVAGIGLGLFSILAERLPVDTPAEAVVGLANAAGPWLCVAFAVGAINERATRGAIAAAAGLAIGVGVYYLPIYATGDGFANLERLVALWLVAAAVVGPAFGAFGALWADRGSRWRAPAAGALVGAVLAEALFRLVQVEAWTGLDLARTDIQVGLVELAAGIAAPLVLLRPHERRRAYATSVVVALCGAVALWGATALMRAMLFA